MKTINNKSEFIVELSHKSECGIKNLPTDVLSLHVSDDLMANFDSDRYPESRLFHCCIDIVDMVNSVLYQGEHSVLTCGCGEPGCAGFGDEYIYTLGQYVYWIIGDICFEDYYVFKFDASQYRSEVKRCLHILIEERIKNPPTGCYDWYPSVEELNKMKEELSLSPIVLGKKAREDFYTVQKIGYKYGNSLLMHLHWNCNEMQVVGWAQSSNPEMAIIMGIPASGKSSFAKERFQNYNIINLDTLRTRENERLFLDDCFYHKYNIVIDNTNCTKEERSRYITEAKNNGYAICGYFMQSILTDCIERNEKRGAEEKIPPQAVVAKSNQLEMPSLSEGFDKLYFVRKNEYDDYKINDWNEK